nr:MAG: hypothetical protein [Bacteriophage sp.]
MGRGYGLKVMLFAIFLFKPLLFFFGRLNNLEKVFRLFGFLLAEQEFQ